MRLLSRLLFLVVAVVVVAFAIANRAPVGIDLWPLPFRVSLPLYWLVLGALALGVVVGGSASWWAGGRWRRRARAGERRAAALGQEAEERSAGPPRGAPALSAARRAATREDA